MTRRLSKAVSLAVDAEQLLPLVSDELRKLATHELATEAPGQTLQTAALVHDAYVRLVDVQKIQQWNSRGHFFAAAAEAMRRVLVENARRRSSAKQGGACPRVKLDEAATCGHEPSAELLALRGALDELARKDPAKAELVKLDPVAAEPDREGSGGTAPALRPLEVLARSSHW